MKKIVSLLLTFALLLSLVTVAFADGVTLSLSADKQTIEKGETVLVKVSIDKAISDVKGFEFRLGYDTGAFEVVSAASSVGSSYALAQMRDFNSDGFCKITGIPSVSASEKSFGMGSGLLYTVAFKAKENITSGDKSFTLSIQQFRDVKNGIVTATVGSSATVTVPQPVTGVKLNQATLTMKTNDTATLTATVEPTTATNKSVTWKSSDSKIVAITGSGNSVTVTAKAEGKATITVTTADGGKTATCTITVVNCKHEHTEKISAKDSTCTVKGHEEYTWCKDCEHALDASKNIIEIPYKDLAPHNFTGTVADAKYLATAATCVAPASYYKSCIVCGEKGTTVTFISGNPDPNNHDLKLIPKVEPTCKDEGVEAYYKCQREGCGKMFKTDRATEIDAPLKIPADPTKHVFDKTEVVVKGTATRIGVSKNVCSVCGVDATGADAFTAYLVVPATLHIEKDAGSTYNPPAGVEFKFVVGSGERVFPKTTGAAAEDLVNNDRIGFSAATQDAAIKGLEEALADTWTVKQTSAGGNGWTVDATEYTVTFTVEGQTGVVTTKITKKVTKTETKKDDATGKDVTETVVTNEPVNAIEFTNTYKSTTKYEPNPLKPAGGSTDTKKDNGKTVKSGKTFDAGIALYVGLSVLSVTGGALVIGKKKEF